MRITKNADGTLTVPASFTDGAALIGDGMATIGPGEPMYESWLEWIEQNGEQE